MTRLRGLTTTDFQVDRVASRLFLFFFYCSGDHRDLHSFPTRRSSDLIERHRVRQRIVGNDVGRAGAGRLDRKSTRLSSSHSQISYAVFCLKKKNDREPMELAVSCRVPAFVVVVPGLVDCDYLACRAAL